MKTFSDYGIELHGRSGAEIATTCPKCSVTRRKKNVRCLSVNSDKGVWCCHHCGWVGSLKFGTEETGVRPRIYIKPEYIANSSIPDNIIAWFKNRHIGLDTLNRYNISAQTVYMPSMEAEVQCIAFPYYKNGYVVNIKYRSSSKQFRQISGAEKCLYGIDDITSEACAVIVEGEIDKLSFAEIGIYNVISVPDGAPPPNSRPSDIKFEYLDNCQEHLNKLTKIIIAVDNDPAGQTLEQELKRRLEIERCYRVSWPEDCKDANDVLIKHGAERLRLILSEAKPYPIDGVIEPMDAIFEVLDLYRNGAQLGISTGWHTLDRYYTVRPGELTIVTGVPSHGKSNMLDALMVNIALSDGWRFSICSPENMPVERHISKLIEQYSGFPFHEGYNQRIPPNKLSESMEWLNSHFNFFVTEDSITIESLINIVKISIKRYGITGLVIDPWNEFDHIRSNGMTETEHISIWLGKLRRLARNYKIHIWVVAHPQKLHRNADGSYPVPTPYDISGSANWRNKADNCFTVWRNEQSTDTEVKIYIQKIRFREVGRVGEVSLCWNPLNGKYREVQNA